MIQALIQKRIPQEWTKKYYSQSVLKKEIQAEVDSTVETLFSVFGRKNIKGIYFKGSASKRWDSVIDYVPGFSDVDIHVYFNEGASDVWQRKLMPIEKSISFSKTIEKGFEAKIKDRLHSPRLQLLSLNELHKREFYTASPKSVVKCIYGAEYPSQKVSDKEKISHAISGILEHQEFMLKFPFRVMDSNTSTLHVYLRDIFWRISSLGNNMLCLLGLSYDDAWDGNRTDVARKLADLGAKDLARSYVQFYVLSWDYILTKDPKYAHDAIKTGYHLLDTCLKRANAYQEKYKIQD